MAGCCSRRRRRRGDPTTASAGGGCAAITAVVFLVAAGLIAFLERSSPAISYLSDGWLHECGKWDPHAGRFLVSTFFGAGVAELAAGGGGEEKVVVSDAEAAGRVALGIAVDTPRRRLLVVYADPPWRLRFAAVAAYDLDSWARLFFTRLAGPGDETSFADDVAVDDDGNAYVTDCRGSKIWKVGPDGELISIMKSDIFFQRKGLLHNLVGLNGIVFHPSGYLLVIHTSGGHLFKVNIKTEDVSIVKVQGSLQSGDGLELLSPTKLVIAGRPTRLVESSDDWETANVTGRFIGPMHRIATSASVKEGDVYINHLVGFGLGKKKTHLIAKAIFSPLT